MIIRFASGSIFFDLGVLGIPTYFGLRRFSVGWRTFALDCLWIGLLLCPLFFLFGLFGHVATYVQIFGMRTAKVAPIWLSWAAVPIFILELWQYRVLTRPDIRALFFGPPHDHNVLRR